MQKIAFSLSEKAQWALSEVLFPDPDPDGDLERDQGPSQLTTDFHKSVSHNLSTHLIVGLVNYIITIISLHL